ncbi:phosphotransferase [Shewanella sp. KX20019]|uniref:phosphotransferase n=1 Tax=Shewanella sp. KX20019 TaxID=2803864 RepID=UPI001927FA01|nr:phosphotransferase [Shewanella sp. KX20019]QQX82108.1 phosphotransferase [Shewanella sp. KX20019]
MSDSLKQQLAGYLTQSGLSRVSVIAPLTQGLSNQNYYVRGLHGSKAEESEWVLRVNSWASSQICDRNSEVDAWRSASDASLAPKMVYVSADKQFYLSEFIAQENDRSWNELISANGAHPMTNTQEYWPGAEQQLLQLLNGLKQLPAPKNVIGVEKQWQIYNARLSQMQQKLLSQPSASHPSITPWLQLFDSLFAQTGAIAVMLDSLDKCLVNLQFSHRDLNPYNILVVQDKLNCIDFEYACSSHPLCDLASIIASHSLSSKQRHWLIENYIQQQSNLNQHAVHAVPAAVDLYWVFAVCWALQMAFDNIVLTGNSDNRSQQLSSAEQASNYLDCASQYLQLIASCS